IGEYIKLKKRGANYLGNCPFHNEKSPSFTVSPSKEIYKCFGCGKSGNTITFLMEHDKLSYVEALRWLAKRYNIEIEETEQTPEQKQLQQTGDSLYIINNFAAIFFEDKLWNSNEGNTIAVSYLKERGFRDDILKKFQIGYNPQAKDELTKALIANQFNKELLPKTGLSVIRNDGDLQDNYRGRIIFPIHNNTGKIIGFGARIIGKNDKAPKYINTPENEIYIKSKILYGTYHARQAIDKANECLLVEGYTDVVSLHQAGIENVVASGGTSLTSEQLRLIKKYTNNLTIIYDGDGAGVKAALRGLDMALEESLNVRLVLIPDNEDPDSYVNKVGTTAFQEFVKNNKKDFIIFQLEIMMKEVGNDITKKNEVVNHIAETLSKINRQEDFIKQQDYIKQCSNLLKIDEGGLINLVNKYKRDKISKEEKRLPFAEANQILDSTNNTPPPPNEYETVALFSQDELHERNVLRVLLEYGLKNWDESKTVAQHIFEEVESFSFENAGLEKLLNTYKDLFYKGEQPTSKSFIKLQDKEITELIISITVFPFEVSENWDKILEGMNISHRDVSHEDVAMSLNYFKLKKIKKLLIQNQEELEHTTDFKQQIQLLDVHKSLKEIERDITKQLGTVIFK
ncbi:MAG: DNA primase, partial [Bacteroidetes bacterium]|nr:DNA primase [Bacteroidota bacterium]